MDFESRYSMGNKRSSDFLVRFQSHNNGTFQGKVENIQSGQAQFFRSFLEMCSLLQRKLDEHDFPPKAAEFRSWKEEADFHWSIGGKHDGS